MSETWTVDRAPEQHGYDKSDWIALLKRGDVHVLVQIGHQETESGAQKIVREFASAPELLEALQQAREFVELCLWNEISEKENSDVRLTIDKVDAAITKATGAAKEG